MAVSKSNEFAHLAAYGSVQGGVCAPPSAVSQALPFTTSDLQIVQSITKQPFTNYEINLIMENNPRDNNDAVDEATNEDDLEVADGNEEPSESTSDDNNISEQTDDAVQVAEEDNMVDEVADEEEVVSEDGFSEPSVDGGSDSRTTTTTTTVLVTPSSPATSPGASLNVVNTPTSVTAGGDINVGSLTSAQGFAFTDSQSGSAERTGSAVSGAGDINGDGLSDFIVGGPAVDGDATDSGAAFVVYGTMSGFSDPTTTASLTGTTGFKLDGQAGSDLVGIAVSGSGDMNGDGYADMIVGASGYSEGRAYVVYGKSASFGSVFDLSLAFSNRGDDGIAIDGATAASAALGQSVTLVGDINGDGFDDAIVAAPNDSSSDPYNSAGVAALVFGGASLANTDISALDGTDGFIFEGDYGGALVGTSVAAGDINGDGFDDYIVGAPEDNSLSGAAYVLYGAASGFSALYDKGDLNGTNGFRFLGDDSLTLGSSLSVADINGDGYEDIIAGAADPFGSSNGRFYVLFGAASFSTNYVTNNLNGTTGFFIDTPGGNQLDFGTSVGTGDFNADGYDDMIISGSAKSGNDVVGYLIFGKASGWSSEFDLADLSGDSNIGVEISYTTGAGVDNQLQLEASNAGDIDGDGVADILLGVNDAGEAESEGAFVIYGSTYLGNSSVDLLLGTTEADAITSDSGVDRIVADLGDDVITGGGGADVIYAGLGNDEITTQSGFLKIDGGGGSDTLIVSTGNLDLTAVALNNKVIGIETIDLVTDTGANTLTLNKQDVLDTGDTLTTNPDSSAAMANSLVVTGAANDAIVIDDGSGWSQAADQGSYNVYTNGQATLFVESTLTDVTGGGL